MIYLAHKLIHAYFICSFVSMMCWIISPVIFLKFIWQELYIWWILYIRVLLMQFLAAICSYSLYEVIHELLSCTLAISQPERGCMLLLFGLFGANLPWLNQLEKPFEESTTQAVAYNLSELVFAYWKYYIIRVSCYSIIHFYTLLFRDPIWID